MLKLLTLYCLPMVILVGLVGSSVADEEFNIFSLMIQYHTSLHKTRDLGRFKGIPDFPELKTDEKREIFHYEHTIVIRDSGAADDKVRRCELIEVYKEQEAEETSYQLQELLNVDVTEVLMDKIMDLIEDCNSVDDNVSYVNLPESTPKFDELLPTVSESSEEESSILSGFVPGTKWCGIGNVAKNYHDLGKKRNVDRCCRSHDMCPISIQAEDEKYNLTNDAVYTKSHCRCDEIFHECLKKENSWTAKLTRSLYFDIARPDCIDGLPENSNEKMKIVPATRNW